MLLLPQSLSHAQRYDLGDAAIHEQFDYLDKQRHRVRFKKPHLRLTTVLWGHTLDQHHTGFWKVNNSIMEIHRTNITLGLGRLKTALWRHTLDQHHTGFWKVDSSIWGHTLDQHHVGFWKIDSSIMGTHTGPTSHWVQEG